jgi:hypothetical protein
MRRITGATANNIAGITTGPLAMNGSLKGPNFITIRTNGAAAKG